MEMEVKGGRLQNACLGEYPQAQRNIAYSWPSMEASKARGEQQVEEADDGEESLLYCTTKLDCVSLRTIFEFSA